MGIYMVDDPGRAVQARITPRLYGDDPTATPPEEIERRRAVARRQREAETRAYGAIIELPAAAGFEAALLNGSTPES
jgi:hypothetical protein